jgi:hypothetical protein
MILGCLVKAAFRAWTIGEEGCKSCYLMWISDVKREYHEVWSRGGFLYFNTLLFNNSKIISPKKYFQIWLFWSRQRRWRDQITLSRHMHWRSKIRHVRWRFRRGKRCHATLAGVTILFCRATKSGVTRQNVRKIITPSYDVGWRSTLYENCSPRWDLQLYSFEFFHLRTLRYSKKLIINFRTIITAYKCLSH